MLKALLRAIALVTLLVGAAQPCLADSVATIADAKGCKTDNPFPKPNETIVWTGGCKDGYLFGHGTLLWIRDGVPGDRYEGDYQHGAMKGVGILHSARGNLEEGHFVLGQLEGEGTFTFANGLKQIGQFVHGQLEGHGVAQYSDGSSFEGEWHEGQRTGDGVLIQKSGFRYDGHWVNNMYDGHGVAQYADGARFEGAFVAGKREGYGVYEYQNGVRYVGDFKNDLFDGHGIWDNAFGASFEGEYANGKYIGDGLPRPIGQAAQLPVNDIVTSNVRAFCNVDTIQKQAKYPSAAMKLGITSGEVRAHFSIDASGKVDQIWEIESTDATFDEVALGMLAQISCKPDTPSLAGLNWDIGFVLEQAPATGRISLSIPPDIQDGRRMLVLIESASQHGGPSVDKLTDEAAKQLAIGLGAVLRSRHISVTHDLTAVPVKDAPRLLAAVTFDAKARYVVVIKPESAVQPDAKALVVDFYALDKFSDARTAKPIATRSLQIDEDGPVLTSAWLGQSITVILDELTQDNRLGQLEATCNGRLCPAGVTVIQSHEF